MKFITNDKIFITYFVILGLTALAGAALAFYAYQCPSFAANLREIPTWIGTFFGALIAIIGAFIVAAWRHDKEAKEKRENLATLIGNENNFFMTNARLTFIQIIETAKSDGDNFVNILSEGKKIFTTEQEKSIKIMLPVVFENEIDAIYRKDISIFPPDIMNYIIFYFEHARHLRRLIKNISQKDKIITNDVIKIYDMIIDTTSVFIDSQKSLQILSPTLLIAETNLTKYEAFIDQLKPKD